MNIYNHKFTLTRPDKITGKVKNIYKNIPCEYQINMSKKFSNNGNSEMSEDADFFIFTNKQNKDIHTGDLLSFVDNFGEKINTTVIGKDYIDFESTEPYIEILVKKR